MCERPGEPAARPLQGAPPPPAHPVATHGFTLLTADQARALDDARLRTGALTSDPDAQTADRPAA
jgi:hypothetical protein